MMPRPGFYAGVLEQASIPGSTRQTSGFSALFTINNPQHPIVIVTYEELQLCMSQKGLITAAPVCATLLKLGVPADDILRAYGNLRSYAMEYTRSRRPGMAFPSIADWQESYTRRQKKDAPKPVRVGRPQRADNLAQLRQNDRFRQSSRPRPM